MTEAQTIAGQISWNQLEALLEEARESLQGSDYRNMEAALAAAGDLVTHLAATEAPPLAQAQKDRLLNAYRQLALIGAAHKQEAQGQLRQIREGRRTVATYGRRV
jgi:hypothetical protein